MFHDLPYNQEFTSKIESIPVTGWLCQLVRIDQYN